MHLYIYQWMHNYLEPHCGYVFSIARVAVASFGVPWHLRHATAGSEMRDWRKQKHVERKTLVTHVSIYCYLGSAWHGRATRTHHASVSSSSGGTRWLYKPLNSRQWTLPWAPGSTFHAIQIWMGYRKQHKEGHANEDLATEGTRGELKIEWFLLQITHISGLR